jgi:hypothetical protein
MQSVTKKARGRPRAAAPLSPAERQRRRRAAAKAKAKPFTSAAEIYEALVEQHGLASAFHQALASRWRTVDEPAVMSGMASSASCGSVGG